MAPDTDRLRELFLSALKVPADERPSYLREACSGDDQLRGHIESLIAAHLELGSIAQSAAPELGRTLDCAVESAQRGDVLAGRYKLLEEIGEGGMGTVWMAQQTEPVNRLVAVKLIKAGMDSAQVIARFEAERQALALMDHPNIARVLDGGTTGAGRPYFVMDLVKGVPITKYCDEHRLTPRQRLELFLSVCQAVQHAHQKGIIHRDIKPSNILVVQYDGRPVPKVIDFGVAKAAGQQLTDKTLMTGFGSVVGTLEYMSPEQAELNQLDIDTRSDIYALGVVLYELLTGSTPLDRRRLKEAAFAEVLRIIREEEPQKPSTRLSHSTDSLLSVSAQRQMEPAKLTKLIRGELDWIVMKALEKDRNRRYETANGFAMDVQRYLNYEPVQAHLPSAWYRFRKFARRNKAALLTATMAGLAILIPIGSGLWLAADRSARQKATERLVDDALENAGVLLAQEKWPDATAIAQRAEWRLKEGGGSAHQRGRVRQLLADLDMVARLEEVRLQFLELTPTGYDFAGSDAAYAAAFRAYGIDVPALEPADAAQRVRASAIHLCLVAAIDDWTWIRLANGIHGHESLRAVARLADADVWRNRFRDAAEKGDTKLLEELTDHPEVVSQPPSTLVVLGRILLWSELPPHGPQPSSNLARAKSAKMLEAAQLRHPEDFGLNLLLVSAHLFRLQQSQPERAAGYCRAALAVRPKSQAAYNALAGCLVRIPGKIDDAIEAYHKAIELKPEFAGCHYWLGKALATKGAWDEAIAAYKDAIRLNPNDAWAHNELGRALGFKNRFDEAIAAHKKAIQLQPNEAWFQANLGYTLYLMNRPDDCIAVCEVVIRLKPGWAPPYDIMGKALYSKGSYDKAVAAEKVAVSLDSNWDDPHYWLGLSLWAVGREEEAFAATEKTIGLAPNWMNPRELLARMLATCNEAKFRDHRRAVELAKVVVAHEPRWGTAWNTLGVAQYRAGNWEAARAALEKALELQHRSSYAWFFLAMTHWRLDRKSDARELFDQGVQWMEKNDPKDTRLLRYRAEAEELLAIKEKK